MSLSAPLSSGVLAGPGSAGMLACDSVGGAPVVDVIPTVFVLFVPATRWATRSGSGVHMAR